MAKLFHVNLNSFELDLPFLPLGPLPLLPLSLPLLPLESLMSVLPLLLVEQWRSERAAMRGSDE